MLSDKRKHSYLPFHEPTKFVWGAINKKFFSVAIKFENVDPAACSKRLPFLRGGRISRNSKVFAAKILWRVWNNYAIPYIICQESLGSVPLEYKSFI